MVCKFCRFRTDDSKTTCPNCGATLTGGKVEEVHEESQVVEEATNQHPTPEKIENFTNEFQHQFNKAKNNAIRFIVLVVIIIAIVFLFKACGK